jgi:parvulin-like peptidyl-prolyl isomerase
MMKRRSAVFVPVVSMVCVGFWVAMAAAQALPVITGKKIVASVNGEPITLEQFSEEIAAVKAELAPGAQVDRRMEMDVLQRMINARLVAQEARNVGLDQLPETQQAVDAYARETLREELAQKIMREAKPAPGEAERLYEDAVREWKITAILFQKEEDAKRLQAGLKTGKDLRELAKPFIAEKTATMGEDGAYLKPKDVDPQFARVLSTMAVGAVSPILPTGSGFVILRLEDSRRLDNPEEREKARQAAVSKSRQDALKAYDVALKKKYVKVKREVLDRVDYEAQTPGFDALLKDTRVVADIKGDQPITVGDLTEQLKYQFFHGLDRAAERKKLNARKEVTLEGMLHRRLFRREALRLGLEKTESYRGKVRAYETSALFGAFVQKVIQADLKLTEDEVKAYHAAHAKEYAAPEMMRLRSLVFRNRRDAESAVAKLKEGAEFQWLEAHAEGQADRNASGVLVFDGKLLTTDDLPGGLRKAIAGSKAGDFRLYASPEGVFYALAIQDVIASRPQPYDQIRQEIAQRVLNQKIKKAVEDYADKLRAVSDIKVYLKG